MKIKCMLAISCLLLFAAPAMADSIAPASYSTSLGLGESVTITKTVTVDDAPPTTAPVDVFFLADSTGSMSGAIANVKASMAAILADTAGLGDIQFAVGEYRDVRPPDIYPSSAFDYRLTQTMTSDTTAVTTAINNLSAGEGGDGPEANLYALHEAATRAETGWRTGSSRIMVWFGDVYGHNDAGDYGLANPLLDARDALVAANINVQAINLGSLDGFGQATTLTTASGGDLYNGISSSAVGATITAAITAALESYTSVNLDLSGAPAGVTVTSSPGYVGAWERDEARDFTFDVTFTGDAIGTYSFGIDALVDGGVVATESDRISVVPVPGAFLLGMLGLTLAGARLRKRRD